MKNKSKIKFSIIIIGIIIYSIFLISKFINRNLEYEKIIGLDLSKFPKAEILFLWETPENIEIKADATLITNMKLSRIAVDESLEEQIVESPKWNSSEENLDIKEKYKNNMRNKLIENQVFEVDKYMENIDYSYWRYEDTSTEEYPEKDDNYNLMYYDLINNYLYIFESKMKVVER